MNEEWDTSGYDGGFVGDSKNKNRHRSSTKIPRFHSFISKSNKRSGYTNHDFKTSILMWVITTFLISAVFHVEWVFISFYGIFLLYTILTKNIKPISYVSSIIIVMGVIFFIAITLVVLLGSLGEASMLQDPIIKKAYIYIIGTPTMSWVILRLLDGWINGSIKEESSF